MDQTQLLMMLMVFGGQTFGGQTLGGQGRGARVVKQALPAMLSGSTAGFALAVHVARKQLEQQDETNTQIIKEVVASGVNQETLKAKLPALYAVFLDLPAAARDSIFPRPPQDSTRPADGSRKGERAAA
jgi:anaerobic C4-dicarboxylate transporter